MISTDNVTVSFGDQTLFEEVSIKFFDDSCYGLIGANGAGKSTFLRVLSGEIEPTNGRVMIPDGKRLAVLKQDQFAYDEYRVLDTVLMGHETLYEVYAERAELYAKEDMTEKEGLRVGDLEVKFGEMDGYTAEADAATMLAELGIKDEYHDKLMKDMDPGDKIRILLAQALFGDPDILLLDEPTNQLDYMSVLWLEKFLLDFENTVIVVSHDRHFLNKVCTHIADVDFRKITTFVGNYDFWQQSSQLMMKQQQDKNKKSADKVKELEDFVRRFSANASKSKQATSRKKLIEKLRPEELATSSRRTPFIQFTGKRPCGDKVLTVKNLTHNLNGERVLNKVSFTIEKGDKVALFGKNSLSKTALLDIISRQIIPDEGSIEWGETITPTYFPKDNSAFFNTNSTLLEWLDQYTEENDLQLLRGFLGRMLFSGDNVTKKVSVLSGGEKARAMFSKMMMAEGNFLMFDEPTDHLDLEAITALNEGLIAFKECMIFTSHDFELLNTASNRVIEVSPQGMIDKQCSFDDYMANEEVQQKREPLYA